MGYQEIQKSSLHKELLVRESSRKASDEKSRFRRERGLGCCGQALQGLLWRAAGCKFWKISDQESQRSLPTGRTCNCSQEKTLPEVRISCIPFFIFLGIIQLLFRDCPEFVQYLHHTFEVLARFIFQAGEKCQYDRFDRWSQRGRVNV